MDSQRTVKPRRHKKRKSRTEVSSDSDSEIEKNEAKSQYQSEKSTATSSSTADVEITAAFTKFYLQRATVELSDDLDRIRGSRDFKDDVLPTLIHTLQQGTSLFSNQEQRRIITATDGKEKKMADA